MDSTSQQFIQPEGQTGQSNRQMKQSGFLSKKIIFYISLLAPVILFVLFRFLASSCSGGLECIASAIGIGFLYLIVLALVPIIFGFLRFNNSTGHKLKDGGESLLVSLLAILLVVVPGYFYISYLNKINQQAADYAFQIEINDFQNQSYPIRILDETGTSTINNSNINIPTITIQSPFTVKVNALDRVILPDGTLTAELKDYYKETIATAKLLPTGQIVNGRHYFQGTLIFKIPSGTPQGQIIVKGVEGEAEGVVTATLK